MAWRVRREKLRGKAGGKKRGTHQIRGPEIKRQTPKSNSGPSNLAPDPKSSTELVLQCEYLGFRLSVPRAGIRAALHVFLLPLARSDQCEQCATLMPEMLPAIRARHSARRARKRGRMFEIAGDGHEYRPQGAERRWANATTVGDGGWPCGVRGRAGQHQCA
eukprot:3650852-Rhodomonas_salina.1